MKMKKLTGKLIAVDMYNCSAKLIGDVKASEATLQQACKDYSMQVCQILCNQEEEQSEYSLSAICKQGHITLHVYPELGFATLDVFSCREGADPAGVAKFLRTYFDADKSKITLLDRGDFGSESDMKPHRRSNVKFIRRTQSFGGKIKDIMLKPRPI